MSLPEHGYDYEACLAACARGEQQALRALYEQESARLLGVAQRIAGDKALAEEIVSQVDNVQGLVNELSITASPSLTQQANDTLITGKVKAGLVDIKDLSANAFKVVTERGSVYLMGRVTQREADIATQVARTTKGAQRVVRVLEIITEEELAKIK